MRTIAEIWPGAQEHEGPVPEDWVLETMSHNEHFYFRLYRAPGGNLYYTRQEKPKERSWPRYDLREEGGRTYARKRWKRKPFEAR